MSLTHLTIAESVDKLTSGEITSAELTEAHVRAIADARALNAFIVETPELAMDQARAVDARRGKGERGVLEGVPLAIKDLFCTKGVQTTAGSKILEGFIPQYESTVTANLWRDGAVMLGKANLDEFAMGSSNMTSAFGPVESPWKRRGDNRPLVPGGSSGGSAAAVAARHRARRYRHGYRRFDPSAGGLLRHRRDQADLWPLLTLGHDRLCLVAGPSRCAFARTVEDTAIMLGSMAGYDPQDSTSIDVPVPDYRAAAGRSVKGLKIGIPKEYRVDGMPGEIDKLWRDGEAVVSRRRGRDRRDQPAAYQIRAGDLLHRRASRMLVQPRAL